MKYFIIALLMVSLGFCGGDLVQADLLYDDPESFVEHNPDGKKYEFVKVFLDALKYLKKNKERQELLPHINLNNFQDSPSVKPILASFVKDNMNLRIIRNLLKNFKTQNNKLLVKIVNLIKGFCDKQIDLNNDEKVLYERIYSYQIEENYDAFDTEDFVKQQTVILNSRRETFKDIMEAAMFVNMALVSPKQNEYDEFYQLGITAEQRENLLVKVYSFKGREFNGFVEGGQSFLAGSINIIRQILENEDWEVIED